MEIGKRPVDSLYAAAIKPIRNRMRQYSFDGLLDAILRYLNRPISSDIVGGLSSLPWVAERVVIWLLSDKPSCYGNKAVHDSDIRLIIDLAWNSLDELLYKNKTIDSIKLFVRQAILSQMPYQVGMDHHAFILQLHLIKKLQENSRLRKFLNQKAGMPIDKYYELGLIFWSHSSHETPWYNHNFFGKLPPLFSESELQVFLKSISYTRDQLHTILSQRTIELDEWFQPTPLYIAPCILHENSVVPFGRPTLRRYFENLMGDWLENEDIKLRQHYDDMISQYVDSALNRSGANYLNESEIRELIGRSVKPCDFMVKEPNGYILFEVKNKSLTKSIPSESKSASLRSKLKSTVLKGKKQLDDTRNACMNLSEFNNLMCYRVIVTNDDLWIGDIQTIIEDYDDPLPIWFLSLKEIDNLVELVEQGIVNFCSFFEKVVERNKDNLSLFSAGMLLNESPYNKIKLPKHLQRDIEVTLNLLKQRLSL